MKIFIDPGHGGRDPGSVGNGLQEKDVVLDLALGLAQALEAYQCLVKLARDQDVYVDIGDRIKGANSWGADFYFSIHVNGHTNTNANGYEDFIHPNAPHLTANRRRAIHIKLSQVWVGVGRANRGMKTANFQVLRETRMSAVLVENGFISNARDAELLRQPGFREKLVEAMTEGIVTALGLEKKKQEGGTPILGLPQAIIAQAKEWARGRNSHQRFIDIAPVYWQLGRQIGIRPEVAYAQAAKETAFGRYGGVVDPAQNNWAGVKTRYASGNRPEDHETFPTPEDGVRGHFNHLAAYVGVEPLGEPHGRYHLVKGLDWSGTINYVEELGGRWAPDPDYGRSIVGDYLEGLLATEAPEQPEPGPGPPEEALEDLEERVARLENIIEQVRKALK